MHKGISSWINFLIVKSHSFLILYSYLIRAVLDSFLCHVVLKLSSLTHTVFEYSPFLWLVSGITKKWFLTSMECRLILYADKMTAAEPFKKSTAESLFFAIISCCIVLLNKNVKTDFHDEWCHETAAKQHDNSVVWFELVIMTLG